MAKNFQKYEVLFQENAKHKEVQNVAGEEFQEHKVFFSKNAGYEEIKDVADKESQEHEVIFSENAGPEVVQNVVDEEFQEHKMLFQVNAQRKKVQNVADDEEFQKHEALFSESAKLEEVEDIADEEFQEHEILFPEDTKHKEVEDVSDDENVADDEDENDFQIFPNINNNKLIKQKPISSPVNISNNNLSWLKCMKEKSNFFKDKYTSDYNERMPPTLGKGPKIHPKNDDFFDCSGHGRKLKGRDLLEFRDPILRIIGFLEP